MLISSSLPKWLRLPSRIALLLGLGALSAAGAKADTGEVDPGYAPARVPQQSVKTFGDLLGYCRNSANPVGRLVLYVCGYRDAERQGLSDFTCTALQLANFWQDVSVDYRKGRIYLPLESLGRYGVTEDNLAEERNTAAVCEMMRFEVARAREWFLKGWPLASMVDKELAIDIELFSRGGQDSLNAIERQGYGVLGRRPAISKARKLALVARAALGKMR